MPSKTRATFAEVTQGFDEGEQGSKWKHDVWLCDDGKHWQLCIGKYADIRKGVVCFPIAKKYAKELYEMGVILAQRG